MNIITEAKWEYALQKITSGQDELVLISASVNDPYRRVYGDRQYCYKVVLKSDVSRVLRLNTLEQEYKILQKCINIQGVPEAISFTKSDEMEVLTSKLIQGEWLDSEKNYTPGVIGKLIKINVQLVLLGISHNDLINSNILVDDAGGVCLVDFDQARVGGITSSFIRAFLGINIGRTVIIKSMLGVILSALMSKLPKTMNILQNFKRAIFNRTSKKYIAHKLPILKDDANDSAKIMRTAWEIAQKSNASSPGILYAYYSIDYEGYHYPGERPWIDRWEILKRITDYSGKRILELGCNMGLLTSYLMRDEGINMALAVDSDIDILEAATIINRAMHVNVEHRVVNFDSEEDWEDKLLKYEPDIVFALNVLNWVKDKDRFLKFLGNFSTIIFEGHDSYQIESERLRSIGFENISVISVSERNRELLLCEK